MKRTIIILIATVATATGCSSHSSSAPAATTTVVAHNESAIVSLLRLQKDQYGEWAGDYNGHHCVVSAVLTNRAMVDMYVKAGSVVAINPDGTAGVEVSNGEQATCKSVLEEKLGAVK